MTVSPVISLIGTGIALGFVHVLTGPDHLSALATLSANVGNCQAFSLGVRWGIGHSTGLLLVGIVLIVVSKDDEVEVPHTVTIMFESLVGVFMLLLGFFGVFRAWQRRPSNTAPQSEGLLLTSSEGGEGYGNVLRETDEEQSVSLEMTTSSLDEDQVERKSCRQRFVQTKTISIFIGIIHGLAGPGGVLGVIPAVQIKDWRLSSLYLGSFCLSSTLVMGCFAATYGTCSAKLGKDALWEFRIECFSAALSLIVGILWLSLLAAGKLEDVFP